MFFLIQRRCLGTPFKLQMLTSARLLHGKNKTTYLSPSLCLQRDVSLLSRFPSLNPVYVTKLQAFHTSVPFFKKKTSRDFEIEDSGIESLKDAPKPAVYLSLAGLIPFVSLPLAMAIQESYNPELAFAQVTYGAAAVSFS